jgi:hypothetical protein
VAGLAGKNDSITSSATVTSSGVPNVATVLKNASSPPRWRSRSGTTTSPGPGSSISGSGWSHGYPRSSWYSALSSGSAASDS